MSNFFLRVCEWLIFTFFFSCQEQKGNKHHIHFVCIATLRLTIQTISFSLIGLSKERVYHLKQYYHFRLATILHKAHDQIYHFFAELHMLHRWPLVFRDCEANLTLNSSKMFWLDRRKFKTKIWIQVVHNRA